MKLAAPKDLVRLQTSGQLETIPEYPPAGYGENGPHATDAEIKGHNKVEVDRAHKTPEGRVADQRQHGDLMPPGVTENTGKPQQQTNTSGIPEGLVGVGTQRAAAPAQPGPATGPVPAAPVTSPAPETSVTPGRETQHNAGNPSVEGAQQMDPMRHGGDGGNLTGGSKRR